jgi:hypothetical protein
MVYFMLSGDLPANTRLNHAMFKIANVHAKQEERTTDMKA